MALQYQIRRSADRVQPYYCRAYETGNRAVLMTSETYWNKSDAINVARLMKAGSPSAEIVDVT